MKATNAELLAAYAELGNVHKVGERFGMRGTSAHERLSKLGAINVKRWTEGELDRLRIEYNIAADAGKLKDLAEDLGRHKTVVCEKARELGLTNKNRTRISISVWKYVNEEHARPIFEDFKKSSRELGQYCRYKGYDKLGFYKCMVRHFPDEWEHVIESKRFSQTKYRIGRQLEYRVRDHLKKIGYFALRSPGSKSPIDLIAIKPHQVLFIQCKRGGNLGVAEWNELFKIASSCGAIPLLASSPTGRGTVFEQLMALKDGSRRAQPKQVISFVT